MLDQWFYWVLAQNSSGMDYAEKKSDSQPQLNERLNMLSWTITFLIVAIIAAALGFGGLAGTAASIAQICFVIFLVMFLVSIISGRRSA